MENSARQDRGRAVEILSILFSFVQNDENPQPKNELRISARKREGEMEVGGMGLIGSAPQKP
jgi:hypothetical protein